MENNTFIQAQKMVEIVSTLIKKSLNNLTYDKTIFGTVKSYDTSTNIAIVNFPDGKPEGEPPTDVSIKNLSGAYLVPNDRVLVNKIHGSLNNPYIDKNLTSPNRKPSGTTGERPTGQEIGYRFFDTTLGKPIWVKTTIPYVWVDWAETPV